MTSDPNNIKRNRIILFSILFLLSTFAFAAETMNEESFNKFTTYYYLNPEPQKAPQFLKYYINSKTFEENCSTRGDVFNLIAYFFGRLAEINPNLLREYEKLYDLASENGKLFLLTVFRVAHDNMTKSFFKERIKASSEQEKSIMQMIIDKPALGRESFVKDVKSHWDMDFLWMEFFITGDKEPIVKLIDVLTWEDKLRRVLTDYMLANHDKKQKARLGNLLKNEVKINADLDNYKINFEGDLDCIYSAYLGVPGFQRKRSKYGIEIKKILNLSDEDIPYMADKGVVMWALQSNARQHPRILEYCKQEFERRNDKSKIELAIILELASKGSIELVPTEEEGVAILKLRE